MRQNAQFIPIFLKPILFGFDSGFINLGKSFNSAFNFFVQKNLAKMAERSEAINAKRSLAS